MSLYNALFGENPLSELLLTALGISRDDVPRYRDCYLDGDEIVIHTRTGGGNRNSYETEERCRRNYPEFFENGQSRSGPWNSDLRKIPGFKWDEDDDFDSTYADFRYEIPEAFKAIFDNLRELGAAEKPVDKWQSLLSNLRNGDTSKPEVQRALKVGEQIFGQIKKAMDGEAESNAYDG